MNIIIKLSNDDLPSDHQKIIQNALQLADKAALKTAFEKMAKAAFLEYCKMIVGNGTPSKLDEVREEKLYLLIQYYFQDRLPTENEVEKMFHLGSKTKGLLQNTISHYKTRLPRFSSYLLAYLTSAKHPDNSRSHYEIECSSPTIIQQLNDIVKQKWATAEIITRVYKTASTYQCSPDTYNKLTSELT